jgi:hypothetical protein
MNTRQNRWYTVPEVWLMIVMLLATMTGSIALVVTAYEHPDDLDQSVHSIAWPLPPVDAAHPSAKSAH